MKKILMMSLLACASAQAQQCEKIVQVAAWNVQWLGNAKEGKRKPQAAEDVASYIKVSNSAVLALAEISPSDGSSTNQTLTNAFALLNREGAQWKHMLFEKREGARAPRDQWTGIAWNESVVQVSGGPWKLDVTVDKGREDEIRARMGGFSEDSIILSRWPYAMKFSAGAGLTDFTVVPVHLKSNIGGSATVDARAYEAELIKEGLEKLGGEERDLIVLGDSNMLTSKENASKVFESMGLKDCNARDLGTHISFKKGEKPAPFDRILLMAQQPETRDSCSLRSNGSKPLDFKVVRPGVWIPKMSNSEFRARLSDHQMVTAGLCVTKDDD